MVRLIVIFAIAVSALWGAPAAVARHTFSVSSIDNTDGLSSNYVKCVHQDHLGFMWFGTKNGLNRFDGFSIRRYNCYDYGLKRGNNNISALAQRGDTLWVGTDRGVYHYDMRHDRFTFCDKQSSDGVGMADWVSQIIDDGNGNMWVLVPNQGVFCVGADCTEYFSVTDHNGDKSRIPQSIALLGGEIYAGTSDQGVFKYDSTTRRFRPVGSPDVRAALSESVVNFMIPISDHVMLLSDITGRFRVYDTLTGELKNLRFSNGGNSYIRAIAKIDNELWVCTHLGVCIMDLTDGTETYIDSNTMGNSGLSDNSTYAICPDREGNVWVATLYGGVNYIQRRGLVFEKYTHGDAARSLSGKLVRGVTYTPDGFIWVGHEDGGLDRLDVRTGLVDRTYGSINRDMGLLTVKSKGTTVYAGLLRNGLAVLTESGKTVGGLHPNRRDSESTVYAVLEDSHGNLWVGLEWGMYVLRAGSADFEQLTDIGYGWVSDIYEDADGLLWVATIGSGVWTVNPSTGHTCHYDFDENYSNGLRSNSVSAVMQDSKGRIWLSTDRGGLSRFNPSTGDFTTYSIEEGLPDNVVYNVLEDKKGFLWFGTNNGMVKFDPETCSVKHFAPRNGDIINSFSYNSAAVDSEGVFYFGGTGGLLAFDPLRDMQEDSLPPLYLTHLRLGNEEMIPGAEGSPITENLLYSSKIELPRIDGSIRFSVASPNYSSHKSVQYSYRLLPNDKEWIVIADPMDISFTGLSAGDYTLELRADNGTLSSVRPYTLSILPSWYQTWWAWLIYVLLFGTIVASAYRLWRYRQEREMVKKANLMSIRREKELYKNKIQFFTEIAHEIRTPLSLIGSPLEAIDEIGVKDERVERYLRTIRMNTNRLLDLTNHLLDFQKIDSAQHSLTFGNVDVGALVQSVVSRFEPTMLLKEKTLSLTLPERPVTATIDKEAVTKIISNLLNNALKYSASRIELELTSDATNFQVSLSSDGEPITGENRLRIFEPFFQIDSNGHEGGVGIGLPLCSTLARLHNGSLSLADESKLANTFRLELPLHQEGVEPEPEQSPVMTEYVLEEESAFTDAGNGYSLMLVEDNDEMRAFLSEQLSKNFTVETAVNGVEALRLLEDRKYDMIVTDIMMPEMDGYELCTRVKENVDLSNIPVVFLTAKNDLDSKVKALKCGGEAYIEKPFSIKYFRQQIMSLLDNREHERKAFLKKPFFTVDNMKLNKADEEFMNRVIAIITENISDENFSVEAMADTFCMSRSSLLRRIKTLFNLSPVELIRLIKLKKAAELIQEGKYRIGDVCFMVGINSSSYFSKLFFKQFGVTPKAFEKQCQKNSPTAEAAREKLSK